MRGVSARHGRRVFCEAPGPKETAWRRQEAEREAAAKRRAFVEAKRRLAEAATVGDNKPSDRIHDDLRKNRALLAKDRCGRRIRSPSRTTRARRRCGRCERTVSGRRTRTASARGSRRGGRRRPSGACRCWRPGGARPAPKPRNRKFEIRGGGCRGAPAAGATDKEAAGSAAGRVDGGGIAAARAAQARRDPRGWELELLRTRRHIGGQLAHIRASVVGHDGASKRTKLFYDVTMAQTLRTYRVGIDRESLVAFLDPPLTDRDREARDSSPSGPGAVRLRAAGDAPRARHETPGTKRPGTKRPGTDARGAAGTDRAARRRARERAQRAWMAQLLDHTSQPAKWELCTASPTC